MKEAFAKKKRQLDIFTSTRRRLRSRPSVRKEDLRYVNCSHCGERMLMADLSAELYTCRHCQGLLPMPAHAWLAYLLDEGSFRERDEALCTDDPLSFPHYAEKLEREQSRTGLADSVVTGSGRIDGLSLAIAVMDNRFMMGSMGVVCGEKLTALIEWATRKKRPLVIVATSGGARMQEGMFSLFQMMKTTQALNRFQEAGLFYLTVLTHPVTGGVMASFAGLGDIILAEPGALIGFAGPRVIRETVGEDLPEGFQRANYALAHGLVDAVVNRPALREEVAFYLRIHQGGGL